MYGGVSIFLIGGQQSVGGARSSILNPKQRVPQRGILCTSLCRLTELMRRAA
jgi:hypothetical protein